MVILGKKINPSKKIELVYLIAGVAISTTVAVVLAVGAKNIFNPQLGIPLQFSGDSIFGGISAQRIFEGWIFNNDRQGFPFGSESRMFPAPDNASFLAIKFLTTIGLSSVAALNICFLIGFPVCFAVSFLAFRYFRLNVLFSAAGAMLYVFLSFHFYRYEHGSYTWYFVVPVYFILAAKIYSFDDNEEFQLSKHKLLIATAVFLSFFGVYYTLFGSILMLFGFVLGVSGKNLLQSCKMVFALVGSLVIGLALNLSPNIWFLLTSKSDLSSSVVRSRTAGEVYSFRLVQLLLPNQDHIFSPLRSLSTAYNLSAPFVNENHSSTLGVVGSLGFIALFFVLFLGVKSDKRPSLWFFASTTWFLFLVGTVGGFGSMASYAGLEMIRGWNRISVFVAFGSIAGAFILLQGLLNGKKRLLPIVIGLISFGLLDQVGGLYVFRTEKVRNDFNMSQEFVGLIEETLPSGSSIYNLPYLDFPEPNSMGGLAYENGEGFIHSELLKWSYGANKSTEGADFFHSLAFEPISRQLRVINRIGFDGIYLDLRGFGGKAEQVLAEFRDLGMTPKYVREDGNVVFFKVGSGGLREFESLDGEQIGEIACYERQADGSFIESCLP